MGSMNISAGTASAPQRDARMCQHASCACVTTQGPSVRPQALRRRVVHDRKGTDVLSQCRTKVTSVVARGCSIASSGSVCRSKVQVCQSARSPTRTKRVDTRRDTASARGNDRTYCEIRDPSSRLLDSQGLRTHHWGEGGRSCLRFAKDAAMLEATQVSSKSSSRRALKSFNSLQPRGPA